MSAKEHYMVGVGKLGRGDLEGAINAFQEALETDQTFFLAHLGWSQALDRKGLVDEALGQVQKAIEIAPDEPLAHTSLSRLYQQKGMIPEAEAEMALSQKLSSQS